MSGTATIRDALALRRSLLRHLGDERDDAVIESLCTASPEAWALFLKAEYCAIPLSARFRRSGLLSRLPKEIRDRIKLVESAELQRVLAARHVIRELDQVAGDSGVRLSILKGGAHAVMRERQPVHVSDVDVLVAREDAPRAWNAFLARGWRPAYEGVSPDSSTSSRIHFAPLHSSRQELPVELHDRFEYGTSLDVTTPFDVVPLEGFRHLDRLTGPSAFLATLKHTVIKHPIRRGHLRDLFFLADAAVELSQDAMSAIRDDLAIDPYSEELGEMFDQARALADGRSITESARGRALVAWKYGIVAGTSPLLGSRMPGWVLMSHIPLERPTIRRTAYAAELRAALAEVAPDSSVSSRPWMQSSVARRLGLPWVVRSSYRVALLVALLASAGLIRRYVHGLTEAPERA